MADKADKVSHASLNGIYVKARELDRRHNEFDAPACTPPGNAGGDVQAHASTHASDAQAHASTHASDVQAHASNADVQTSASAFDAQTHAS